MSRAKRICSVIDKISEKIALGSSFLAVALMVLMVWEVVARYVFNKPTIWSFDINQFLFCGLTALGAAYTLRTDGHVSIDILYSRLNSRVRGIMGIFTTLIMMAVLYVIIWQSSVATIDAYKGNFVTQTFFAPPVYPAKALIPIGMFFFLLQAIARIIRYVIQAIVGEEEEKQDDFSFVKKEA